MKQKNKKFKLSRVQWIIIFIFIFIWMQIGFAAAFGIALYAYVTYLVLRLYAYLGKMIS